MRSFQKRCVEPLESQATSSSHSMAQSVILFLGTILSGLEMLDSVMEDYLEIGEPRGWAG